jgi:hypothetical protein
MSAPRWPGGTSSTGPMANCCASSAGTASEHGDSLPDVNGLRRESGNQDKAKSGEDACRTDAVPTRVTSPHQGVLHGGGGSFSASFTTVPEPSSFVESRQLAHQNGEHVLGKIIDVRLLQALATGVAWDKSSWQSRV